MATCFIQSDACLVETEDDKSKTKLYLDSLNFDSAVDLSNSNDNNLDSSNSTGMEELSNHLSNLQLQQTTVQMRQRDPTSRRTDTTIRHSYHAPPTCNEIRTSVNNNIKVCISGLYNC